MKNKINTEDVISLIHNCEIEKAISSINYLSIKELNNKYQGSTLLHHAIENGCEEIINLLLHKKVDVNIQEDVFGLTALHNATWAKYSCNIIKDILQAGADVSILDNLGRTALHYAAAMNSPKDILCMLIEAGTNLNQKDIYCKNALQRAIELHSDQAVEFLKYYFTHPKVIDYNSIQNKHESLLDLGLNFVSSDMIIQNTENIVLAGEEIN